MDFDDACEHETLPARLSQWRQQYEGGDQTQRREAMEALCELAREHGAALSAAQPVLLAALADEDEKAGESASWALCHLAPHSIAALTQALGHPWAAVRRRAAQALGNVGEVACAAAPALRRLLDDADEAASCRAAWALGLLRDTAEPTLAELWRMSAEGGPRRRASALHALGNLGKRLDSPAAWQAHRPLLLASLQDADADVRWSALYAAESLRLPPQTWADLLGAILVCETADRVLDAVLHKLEAVAGTADLSALLAALLDLVSRGGARGRAACDVLAAMRPAPTQALPALTAALAHDDLAFVAARTIWRVRPDADLLLPVLDRLFDTHDEEVCDLLCEMGPAAAPLLPRVLRALASDVWDVQWAAADAVAAIAPSDDESRRALLAALGHDSPRVRSGAARALARSGVDHVPALRRLVAAPDDDRSAWAAFALGQIGEAAVEALGELRQGMHAQSPALARACQIAVARIGSLDSLDLLIDLVADPDDSLPKAAAAEALGLLGPAALPARPVLAAAALSGDDELANAAQLALERMDGGLHC